VLLLDDGQEELHGAGRALDAPPDGSKVGRTPRTRTGARSPPASLAFSAVLLAAPARSSAAGPLPLRPPAAGLDPSLKKKRREKREERKEEKEKKREGKECAADMWAPRIFKFFLLTRMPRQRNHPYILPRDLE
jgi:hypothetical protein